MTDVKLCTICGETMPEGEQMFNFHGYSGTCPKEPMYEDHQFRVIAEAKQISENLDKLEEFMGGTVFPMIDADEQSRLNRQFLIMQLYSQVLAERVSAFKKR